MSWASATRSSEDVSHRFVARVTASVWALGVALAQETYKNGESSERAALKELLSKLDLVGVLIQAACISRPDYSVVPGAGERRSSNRQIQPEAPTTVDY